MSKPKPLFDDAEEQPAALHVNKEFAKRFEHNSKRDELQRLQAKYPHQAAKLEQGGDSSSDGEDDDEGLIDERTQAQIFETLLKIRRRDQSIYDAQAKFYSSDSEEEEDEEEAAAAADEGGAAGGAAASKQRKEKPMYLKDVIYKQAMEGIVESEEEEEEAAAAARQQPRTYAQEQQQLKQAFLSAFEENVEGAEGAAVDGFGAGVLQQRPGKKGSAAAAAAAAAGSDDQGDEEGGEGEAEGADSQRVQQLLDGYFGRDHELTRDDQFLKRYIMNKGWVEEGEEEEHYGAGGGEGEEVDDEEDEQFVQQAEQFEHAYNFRFEEPGSSNIVTHPRNIEGTVRKEDDRRKRARAEKAARQAAAEEQRKAEVRRLKNLKRAEIEGKLTEIQSVAGQAGPGQEALDALVGGDFDPDEYDRQMAAAFGDDYYAAEGEEEEEDAAFERELQAMAAYGSDEEEAEEGGEGKDPQTFAALQKRLAAQRRQRDGGEGEEGGSEEVGSEEEEEEEGREVDPEAAARVRAEVQRLLEEYYKLNYEDVVGGVPTRFRYKEVAPDTFGLGVEEILGMEDKELNQVVGLKTLAPYREEHRRFRPNYQKLNQLRQQRDEEQGQRHGGGKKAGKQYWEREGHQGQGQKVAKREEERQPRPVKTVAERRLESFAKPVFKKTNQQYEGGRERQAQDGGFKKRKRDEQQDDGGAGKQKQPKQSKSPPPPPQQQQQQVAGDGAKLSKAAKKNLKRREKRRGKPEAAAA